MPMSVAARAPGGPEVLEWIDLPVAQPGPGEVLVRHEAVGLNFIDTYYRSGLYAWPTTPLVPGAEAAGVVTALGDGVEGISVGDRVAYIERVGAYCEQRVLRADRLVVLPAAISSALAASIMLKGLTAHALLTSSFPVQAGQTVLVHAAAGGVGQLLGQWLKALGAVAIGTVGSPEKAEIARANGYAHTIEYRHEDFAARVAEITGGGLCDVVYDSVGNDTWRGSLNSLKPLGRYVNFGQSSGPIEGFRIADLAQGSKSVIRPVVFDYVASRGELARRAGDLFARIADGTLTPTAPHQTSLRDAAAAHRALEQRVTTGSGILVP